MELIKCDSPKCEKTFKRKSELRRHQLSHSEARYSCPAIDCNRKGKNGFHREDKLIDHVTQGHDDEGYFSCVRCPNRSFLRDTFAVHTANNHSNHLTSDGLLINQYRTCPIPRCSFRINVGRTGKGNLDELPQHFIDKHDLKGRRMYAQSIKNRGYDPETAEIVCPLCVHHPGFKTHFEFYHHFLETHNDGITPNELDAKSCFEKGEFTRHAVYSFGASSWQPWRPWRFWGYNESPESLPREIYEHRRTLLSLWPAFIYHPVWADLK
ncbi:hypothetical protein BS50DRAFT_575007 [Corynespora cassiicola Philippines]|uniref:C2H2-type domain-containing protein n=1 Tax=Corynespora cassiicola Philippines TaxID=1448308 RepID=A0A2T2NHE1_CORCC|nr:hypothetical protein BS50DRAFT_575007 [Corynespora cassiicola Philippines]